jgi:NodT family efflux transporter outer membrane factor (OMF) lipoprotein
VVLAGCATILLLSMSAGCRVGPDYKKPDMKVPAEFQSTSPNIEAGVSGDLSKWWTNLDDPVLNLLVDKVMQGNLDLKVAGDRIAQAQAIRGIISSSDKPAINGEGSARRDSYSLNSLFGPFLPERRYNDYIGGFDARWELDLFGKTARSVESAEAGIEAAKENQRAVMVAMSAGVAKQYILVRQLQKQIEVANNNILIQQNTLDVVEQRHKAGLVNELVLQQAKAQLEVTRSVLPKLDTALQQAIHRIGILTGQEPRALEKQLITVGGIPATKQMIPIGLPSELLTRRPDVRAAERNLAAATANIGVATADLFPRFSLTGTLGQESVNSGSLSGGESTFWSLASGFSWPILDSGTIRANIKLQDARQQQALNIYIKSILIALEDVENALVSYGNEQQQLRLLEAGTEANRKSVELATQRYQKGLVDFLNVLDAQRQLYQSEDALAVSRGQLALSLIALYESLGGGWDMQQR